MLKQLFSEHLFGVKKLNHLSILTLFDDKIIIMKNLKIYICSFLLLSCLSVFAYTGSDKAELIDCMSGDVEVASLVADATKVMFFHGIGGEEAKKLTTNTEYQEFLESIAVKRVAMLNHYPALKEMSESERAEILNTVALNMNEAGMLNGFWSCFGSFIANTLGCVVVAAWTITKAIVCMAAGGVWGLLLEAISDGVLTPIAAEQTWGTIAACFIGVGIEEAVAEGGELKVCGNAGSSLIGMFNGCNN